ncbi:DUF5994 family protein [Streptomyces sp. NPDC018031]|uniref:DUF5994 family protein n=1 Tax=Streptomyces sp. NPDC018031 TaxID=3365033 RepID=UPI0037999194
MPGRRLPSMASYRSRSGAAAVRLETTRSREGLLDGAWWPRTRDIGTGLPALIRVLTGHLGPITRLGVDASAWDGIPPRLVIDGQVVHLESEPVRDGPVLVTRGHDDHFALLAVPPDHHRRRRPRSDGPRPPRRQRHAGRSDPPRHHTRA